MNDAQESATLSAAADELYAADPAEFVAARARLASRARQAGDADTAKQIAALRKPTVSAAIVNRFVLSHPEALGQLVDLNERLQSAHTELDAAALRELTVERRHLVDELTRAALDTAGSADATTSLRDDVTATFDAAIADPQVAGRLGRLLRAERWSGFGVAAGGLPARSPALRLLQGGRSPARAPARKPAEKPEKPAAPAADREAARERQRKLRKAREAFARADADLEAAQTEDAAAREQVRELTDQLAHVQRDLEDAKTRAGDARLAVKTARTRQRAARTALDRAERGTRS
jgi:hypothetical protein